MKLYNLPSVKLNRLYPSKITIAVYGMGKIGLPLATVFANKGFHVIGVDIDKEVVEKINQGINPITGEPGLNQLLQRVVKKGYLNATTDAIYATKNSDIKIILVPIFIDEHNNPDTRILNNVVKKIAQGLQKGDIVILESTAPPGTTLTLIGKKLEQLSSLKLNKDFGVAHCPERISSKTAIKDIEGRLCPKIVSGSDLRTTKITEFIYRKVNKRGVITVQNPTVAELVKIWGEVYRDVNIAFANNLYLNCRELGVDALEVIKASNTNPYSKILTPGPGVGGHCIPVYPHFILKNTESNQDLLKIARKINDSMSKHVITLAKDALRETNTPLAKANILILGLTYREGVKEVRKSPGLKIAQELVSKTANVFAYDPLFSEKEIKEFGLQYKKGFSNIDCIIITTGEDVFKKMDWKKIGNQLREKVVVDTKDILNAKTLSSLGFVVRRVGYAK